MQLRVDPLPLEPIAAASCFHAEILPEVARLLASRPEHLLIVFPSADYTHRAWRLAAVQGLARENAPVRVNALESLDEAAIVAAEAYLARAPGLTGQVLVLDGGGAGPVV